MSLPPLIPQPDEPPGVGSEGKSTFTGKQGNLPAEQEST